MADPIFLLESRDDLFIPYKRMYEGFSLRRNGAGYFSGSFPDGTVTIAGRPISAEIRVLLRTLVNGEGDGYLAAKTQSLSDGTWRIDGLNPSLRYDVVARYDGENDVIMSDVTPMVD